MQIPLINNGTNELLSAFIWPKFTHQKISTETTTLHIK